MPPTSSIDSNNVSPAHWQPRMASAEEFGISVAEDGSQVINYTVVRGDTLSRISRALRNHHGITVSYQAIAAQNGIDNPNLIRVGQQLTITVPAGQEVELAEPPAQLVETAETAETNEVNQLAPAPAPATEEAGECDEEYDLINAYACDDEVGVCYDDNYGLAELGVALFGDQCIDLDMEDGYVDPATETVAAPLPSGPGVTRPQVVSNVLANPALINQSDTRLALEHQAEHALQAGNIELATEIADLFLANCVDEEGLTAGANIYLNVGNSLF
ncbi:MAG: LysM peptidoglycan-binding domain-containing protein, partial [Candidatus Saganbacteria bacterium]|nr:LysM peptidoglycan-binding domain-containing protein [Candidatus Saganbacteria bacterium]